MLRLGMAFAHAFPGNGDIGLACGDSRVCGLAVREFEVGIRSAGRGVAFVDAGFAAQAAFAAQAYALAAVVFVDAPAASHTISIRCFAADGMPPPPSVRRKWASHLRSGEMVGVPFTAAGRVRRLNGTPVQHAAAAMRIQPIGSQRVRVEGNSASAAAMHMTLTSSGIIVMDSAPAALVSSQDGFSLRLRDENGVWWDWNHIVCLLAMNAMETHGCAAVPYQAPSMLDRIAVDRGYTLLRSGRDENASIRLPYRDACFAAMALCPLAHNQTFSALMESVPDFAIRSVDVQLNGDRGSVMRAMQELLPGAEMIEGIRRSVNGGVIHIMPLTRQSALRITAESVAVEIAAGLCDFYQERARDFDRK
jgi:hypothetical protein